MRCTPRNCASAARLSGAASILSNGPKGVRSSPITAAPKSRKAPDTSSFAPAKSVTFSGLFGGTDCFSTASASNGCASL